MTVDKSQDASPQRIEQVPTVVVAEDDEGLRQLLVQALRSRGFAALQFNDGRQAFREIDRRRGDGRPVSLLITDLHMPHVDGEKLITALAHTPNRTPFIVISSFLSTERQESLLRRGASAVFSKPFDLRALMETVAQLVPLETPASPAARLR